MNEEEKKNNAARNLKRVQYMAGPSIFNGATKEQQEAFKEYKIIGPDNKEIRIENIDFKRSIIFICMDKDFSCLIPYYGLLKINNVSIPDYSYDGKQSFISSRFMVVNSRDVRFSQIPQDSFYDINRDGSIPDSWNSIMYAIKDLCIWRLATAVGMGDNEKMYNTCCAWIQDRYMSGKMDWIFYTGPYESFKEQYGEISNLEFPVYYICRKDVKVNSNGDKKTLNLW